MLIIVEGCDGTGKTTFVNLLAELTRKRFPTHDVRILHYGPPKRHPLEEYELDIEWYRPGIGVHLIVDRLHWGEVIYGPLYRKRSELGVAGFRHVEMFLQARGAVLAHCGPPLEVVRENLAARGEDYLKTEDVEHVVNAYLHLHTRALMPVMNFPHLPDQVDAEDVLRYAQFLDRKYTDLTFSTYIGGHEPSYLLLGERRNHPTEQEHQAAFVPYGVTSGRFLLEALSVEFLMRCGIANALEEDVRALWKTLGEPNVVALGQQANKVCVAAGVPHAAVPHPQYVRRFHHKKQAAYGRLIEDCAMRGRGAYLGWPKRPVEDV